MQSKCLQVSKHNTYFSSCNKAARTPIRKLTDRPRDPTIPRLDLSLVSTPTSTSLPSEIRGVTRPGNISPGHKSEVTYGTHVRSAIISGDKTSNARTRPSVTWKDEKKNVSVNGDVICGTGIESRINKSPTSPKLTESACRCRVRRTTAYCGHSLVTWCLLVACALNIFLHVKTLLCFF